MLTYTYRLAFNLWEVTDNYEDCQQTRDRSQHGALKGSM